VKNGILNRAISQAILSQSVTKMEDSDTDIDDDASRYTIRIASY
jgi:hypothetical protein